MSHSRNLKCSAILILPIAIAAFFLSGCGSDPYSVDYGNSVYTPQPQVQQPMYYSSGFHDPWYHRPYYGRPYYGHPYGRW